jgi:hypothetical protein
MYVLTVPFAIEIARIVCSTPSHVYKFVPSHSNPSVTLKVAVLTEPSV